MIPRPPRLLPVVEYRQEPDPKQFEHGFRFLASKFAEMEAELERLRTMIYDKQKNSLVSADDIG